MARDMADTSALVQLAGISLEQRWVDQSLMRMSETIRISHLPLFRSFLPGREGTELAGVPLWSITTYDAHQKPVNLHSYLHLYLHGSIPHPPDLSYGDSNSRGQDEIQSPSSASYRRTRCHRALCLRCQAAPPFPMLGSISGGA